MTAADEPFAWDDPRLGVKREPAWTAKRRLLQSWWREHELGAAPAEMPGRRFPVGNQLDPSALELVPDLNFLTPEAYAHAVERVAVVQKDAGTIDADRLYRNLLSSMPMCFNAFGFLRTRLPAFTTLFQQAFVPEAVAVDNVECEWSPRPKRSFLDDNTAFDAAVWFTDGEGRKRLLGVEAKYTDSFSERTYDDGQYRTVTAECGWFVVEGTFDKLKGSKTSNQLWRNMLLAASLESPRAGDRRVDWAGVAVLCLASDTGVKKAVAELEPLLTDVGKDRLRVVTLEDLVAKAADIDELADWAEQFRRRYLGDPKALVAPPQTRLEAAAERGAPVHEIGLPDVIAAYQRAHDGRDTEAALATFAPTATVEDDGQTYTGSEQVRGWLDGAASEFTYTRTLLDVEDLGGGEVLVRNHLAGDFPGGEVDLQYRFRVEDGLITHLVIAP